MRGVVQLPMPRALMFVCMCLSLGCGGSNSAHGHIPIEKTSVEIRSIGFEWETECTSHLQTQWVGVDEYMDKVAGLADGQVATVWAATMDRWLAHEALILGGTLAMEMPEELAMNIKRDVYRELIPRMGSQMGEKILQSAHESMVDSVIESVSGSLHEVVPKLVTDGLAPVLPPQLVTFGA